MNMDEFWKNIWTEEEGQAMAAAMLGNVDTDPDFQTNLQHGSRAPPRAFTRKTVDEVWTEIQRHNRQQEHEEQERKQRRRPVGEEEMTLEDFLVKIGVIRDNTGVDATANNAAASSSASTFGGQTPQAKVESITEYQQESDWYNYQKNQHQQQQFLQAEAAAATRTALANRTGLIGGMLGKVGNMLENPSYIRPGLVPENLAISLSLSPDLASLAAVDISTTGPVSDVVVNAVERRQQRMTKNRESAARSRARKQAYTVELEAEVMQLKEEISRLKRQRTFGPQRDLEKPLCVLRRTNSTSW